MEDTAYIKYRSLATLLIWVNTEYTWTFLKGTWYFCHCKVAIAFLLLL